MPVLRHSIVLVFIVLGCSTTFAQSTNYSQVQAASGVAVQINFHASAHKNCTPSPPPTIRPLEVPKSGTLVVRKGEATINSIAGCQPFKTPAEIVFYQSKPSYVGQDHFIYEMTASNGEVSIFDVTIEVKEGPKPPPAKAPGNPT